MICNDIEIRWEEIWFMPTCRKLYKFFELIKNAFLCLNGMSKFVCRKQINLVTIKAFYMNEYKFYNSNHFNSNTKTSQKHRHWKTCWIALRLMTIWQRRLILLSIFKKWSHLTAQWQNVACEWTLRSQTKTKSKRFLGAVKLARNFFWFLCLSHYVWWSSWDAVEETTKSICIFNRWSHLKMNLLSVTPVHRVFRFFQF